MANAVKQLVLSVVAKVAAQLVAQASNGGVLGVVQLDSKAFGGRDVWAVVYDAGFVDPNQRKGAIVPGSNPPKRFDRTGGARLQRGRGRFATGLDAGTHTVKLTVQHNDRDAVAAPDMAEVDLSGLL